MELKIGKCPFCGFVINMENRTVCSGCDHKIFAAKWIANDGKKAIVSYFKTQPEAKGAFMEERKAGKVKYYDYADRLCSNSPYHGSLQSNGSAPPGE